MWNLSPFINAGQQHSALDRRPAASPSSPKFNVHKHRILFILWGMSLRRDKILNREHEKPSPRNSNQRTSARNSNPTASTADTKASMSGMRLLTCGQ